MKVYHYTKEQHLAKILKNGFVNPEDDLGYKIPSFVWLTTEEHVPNTSRPVNHII